MIPPPRVVFDCMVFLQGAARRGGPAARCLDAALDGTVELLVSRETMAEVADVLMRPELRRKFPVLTDEAVRDFLQLVVSYSTLIDPVTDSFDYPRDPKDEPYLRLAITGSASYIVSRDKDLLDLMEEHVSDGHRLRELAPALQLLDPVEFLALLTESPTDTSV